MTKIGDLIQYTRKYPLKESATLFDKSTGTTASLISQTGNWWKFAKIKEGLSRNSFLIVVDLIENFSGESHLFIGLDGVGVARPLFSYEFTLVQKGNKTTT
jgi:hypothetical protein